MSEFFIPIISGTIGAYIAYMLSVRKFRTEKWWELKISSYQKLISALYDTREFSSNFLDQEMGIKALSEAREKDIRDISFKAHQEIIKSADVGSFLFSNEAIKRLAIYKKEVDKASNEDSWFEYLDNDYAATNSCLKDIINIAKKDLEELSRDPIQNLFFKLSKHHLCVKIVNIFLGNRSAKFDISKKDN